MEVMHQISFLLKFVAILISLSEQAHAEKSSKREMYFRKIVHNAGKKFLYFQYVFYDGKIKETAIL